MQMPKYGLPDAIVVPHHVDHAVALQPAYGVARGADAGQYHRRGPLHVRRLLRHHKVRRMQRQRPADAAQVTGAVVDNRNHVLSFTSRERTLLN